MNDTTENLMKVRELVNELVQTNTHRWVRYGGFLSVQWWLLVAFFVVPWIIWIKVADRQRTLEILFMGTVVMLIAILLDLIGYNINFWDYPIEFMPLVPGAWPFDLSVVPVAYMLLYQYLRTWKSYCIGLAGMTLLYAFIGEPLANALELVVYIKWSNIYSVVVYILTGVFVRAFVLKLKGTAASVSRLHPIS